MDTSPSPLRVQRLKLGLTLDQLAAKVGISKPSLSQIETGKQKPRLETVRNLVDATGLTAAEIDPRLINLVPGAAA